jgi:hypothetical protein
LLEWAEVDFDILSRETDETWPEVADGRMPVYIRVKKHWL